MGRAPCCEKVGLKRGRWTAEEDQILTNYIHSHGEGSWRSLPKNAGLLRCGKSCRLRWINYLKSDLKRGNITPQEEETIVKLHNAFGNKWSSIAAQLPGRTDNEIKNYWNSHLSRKIYTFTKQFPGNQPVTTITNIIHISSTALKRRSSRRQTSQSDMSIANKKTASSAQANPENDTNNQEKNSILCLEHSSCEDRPEQKVEDGFCLDTTESVISDHDQDNDERETDQELCLSMDKENRDLGPYEWLDGEIMRLSDILRSGDTFDPRGNNVILKGDSDIRVRYINEEREKGTSTNISDHERDDGSSSASSMYPNSGFDTDEWLYKLGFST